MSYIAVVRLQNGTLVGIKSGDEKLAEWVTKEQAESAMEDHILSPLGIEIVEIDS